MPWYEDWFDRPEYEQVYQRRDEDEAARAADLVERVAEPAPGARLLDVGCGRGRHARAFARRGYRVTGLDLSEKAIADARARAEEEGLDVDFRQRDMRAPMGEEAFDGAVNLFSSFGYFEDAGQGDAEHQQVIDRIAAALAPPSEKAAGDARRGGFFVQDFLNAAHVRATFTPESTRTENGLHIQERRWIEDGRINKAITLHPAEGASGGGGAPAAPQTFRESVRLLELADFRRLYENAGLRLCATYGTYDGAPFDEDSPRLIMLSRKT